MAGQSEEKTLPPSKKKLDDARKKGEVPRSKDLTSGAALAGGPGFLVLGGGAMFSAMTAMLDQAGQAASGDFEAGMRMIGDAAQAAALRTVAPVWVAVPGLAVLAAIIGMRGIPFATDPVAPKMERINPVEGLKRMFKMRALIELVKTLLKAAVLVTAIVAILAGGLQALVLAPSCGFGCAAGVFRGLFVPLAEVAAVLSLVAGGADLGLQQWLFRRDQKMGVSEAKRERKEMDGNPEVRAERRLLSAEAARIGMLGSARATFAVLGAGQAVVGLRYKAGETYVPLIVSRGQGERGAKLLAEARQLRLPLVDDPSLAAVLVKLPPGRFIPEEAFKLVAAAMSSARPG